MGLSPPPVSPRCLPLALLALLGLLALACRDPAPAYLTFPENELDYYRRDPVVGHLHQPQAQRRMAWSEHPRQFIEMKTNNLGFREDADTESVKPPGLFRVLVTGDSHTDGVVFNAESFANQLELRLIAAAPGNELEVLNGGAGYYGPFEYRRFFTRQLALAPDLVIVNVFMGNDFIDACRELEATRGLGRQRPADYLPRLMEADAAIRSTVAQGLNQIYYFKTFPEMVEPAIAATAEQLIELRDDAKARGIPLVVALQPARLELDHGELMRQRLIKGEKLLGTGADALKIQDQLHRGLASRLAAAKIELLDLYDSFAADPRGLFWDADEHLAIEGHLLLADELCRRLATTRLLPCRPTAGGRRIFADGFETGDPAGWGLVTSAAGSRPGS